MLKMAVRLLKRMNLIYLAIFAILSTVVFILIVTLNNYVLGFKSKTFSIDDVPFLFQKYYANWHHKSEQKNKVLIEIQDVVNRYHLERHKNLSSEKLIEIENQALNAIKKLTYDFSDAHVTFEINPKKAEASPTLKTLKSQIQIDFTTLTLESCLGCEKHIGSTITRINGHSQTEWDKLTETQEFPSVSFSTETGRLYKKMKFLETFQADHFKKSLVKTIQLEDLSKNKTDLVLEWKEAEVTTNSNESECIQFKRIDQNRVEIRINNFWCQPSPDSDRKAIVTNFKQQYLNALKQVTPKDEVIIDVSRNSGGGDDEVDLVLSSLIADKANLPYYSYQFLKRTALAEKTVPQLKSFLISLFNIKSEWITVINYQVSWDDLISKDHFIGHQVKEVKISPLCSSACETFILALKQSQQFKITGTATHGSLGLPISYKINFRYSDQDATLTLPSCRIFDNKMQLMEGVGVL